MKTVVFNWMDEDGQVRQEHLVLDYVPPPGEIVTLRYLKRDEGSESVVLTVLSRSSRIDVIDVEGATNEEAVVTLRCTLV